MPEKNNSPCEYAGDYDEKSKEYGWHAPEILFGLMYAHIRSGQSLLDLGIGTGLSSLPFHRAGLKISGIDTAPDMLAKCREKNLPFTLIQHDLTKIPWPCDDLNFHHIVSTGVFHSFGNLDDIFSESARVIKPGGIFGFDFQEYNTERTKDYEKTETGIYFTYDTEYRIRIYAHSEAYIFSCLKKAGFEPLDDVEFLAAKPDGPYFRAVTARRRSA